MAAAAAAASLDGNDRSKELPMLTSLMSGELAATRQAELIAAAEAERLALQVRRARRDERRSTAATRVRRTWVRTTAQPART
jgi:hypothetical protein